MIHPTVGRIVHFFEEIYPEQDQPRAAIIAYVHNERLVNLMVSSHQGGPYGAINVPLLQDDAVAPEGQRYCKWMDYQKEQLVKTESLEMKLSHG